MRTRCPNCNCEFDGTRVISRPAREGGFALPAGKAIFDAFVALTGAEFRVIPTEVKAQACMAARAGFTAEDLDHAVAYIQWGMANDCGFGPQSLTWGKLFGDAITGFQTLQDRLGAAKRARKERGFRHVPKYTGNTPLAAKAKPAVPAKKAHSAEPDAAKAEQIRAQVAAFNLKTVAENLGTDPLP